MATLTLRPNADGTVALSCSSGTTHNTLVNESVTDDASYVYGSGASLAYDLLGLPDHTSESGVITNVRVYGRFYATASGTGNGVLGVYIGATAYNGTPVNVTTSYLDTYADWANNPNSGVAWTWTDIDNLQLRIGCKRPSSSNSTRCTQAWVVVTYNQAYTLACDGGTFTETGGDATLTYTPVAGGAVGFRSLLAFWLGGGGAESGAKTLVAESGSFTLTGGDAALKAAFKLAAETGAYTLGGQDAAFLRAYRIAAESGSFTVTGGDATFRRTYRLDAQGGSYTLTGQDATLSKTTVGAYTLACDSGSFTLTGQDAAFKRTYRLAAEAGSYTLTGGDATLSKTTAGAYSLTCDGGTFTLTGGAATFVRTYKLAAASGAFTLTGGDATFGHGYTLAAAAGAFVLTGQDATFLHTYVLAAAGGVYVLTGGAAAFLWSGTPKCDVALSDRALYEVILTHALVWLVTGSDAAVNGVTLSDATR